MKVLGFGVVKDLFGSSSVIMDEAATIDDLKAKLEAQYPGLKMITSYMVAVNGEYAKPGTVIQAGDEVAIIPPVSGG